VQVANLGPLEVRTDDDSGSVLDVGGSGLRALLIMLALRPGQLVASAARAELGEAGFEAAYQRGQSVTMDTLAALIPRSHPALER
jgi:hypothetical protein